MENFQLRMMVSYFLLALAIILAFNLIVNLDLVVGWFGWILNVMSPFISGFVLAYLLSIPCSGTEKLIEKSGIRFLQKNRKGISILIVYLLFVFIIYMAIILIVPPLIASIMDLINQLPIYYQQLEEFIISLNEDDELFFYLDLDTFYADLAINFGITGPMDVLNLISPETLLTYLGTIFSGATMLFRAVLAFISSIYFLFETENLAKFTKRVMITFFPVKVNKQIFKYARKMNADFKRYIFCIIIDCLVLGAVTSLIFAISGSPYALFLGLMLGVLNAIPYFGSIIGTIIAIIVIWLTQGFTLAAILAIVLLVVQQLDANLLQPRLYGGSMKISPLLVIICVSAGGAIGGVIGMIVAIPITSVFKNMIDDLIRHRERENGMISRSLQLEDMHHS